MRPPGLFLALALVAAACGAPGRTQDSRTETEPLAAISPSPPPTPLAASPQASPRSLTPTPTPTATASPPARQTAQVVSVIDGDTIRVSIAGRIFTVRYIGIDTPETVDPSRPVEPYGREAAEVNRRLVEGKTVELDKDVSETDRFGRLLRYVYVETFAGTVMVNAELVRLGYARVSTFPPDVKYAQLFLDLERQARALALGLWAQPSPTPTTPVALASPSPSPIASPTATPFVRTPAPTTATPFVSSPAPSPSPAQTSSPTLAASPTPSPTPAATPTPSAPPAPTATLTSAPAAAGVVITALFYDGQVPYTEADEYVEIKNAGSAAVNMSGWRIVSARAGQTYFFPAITMQPGQICRVYTNENHPEWCALNWGRGSAVWNNSGDRAELIDPAGKVVSSVGYKGW